MYRVKGRLATKKQYDKHIQNINNGKRRRLNKTNETGSSEIKKDKVVNDKEDKPQVENQAEPVILGYRVINLHELSKNMFCKSCEKKLYLSDILSERRFGLGSVFLIKCTSCLSNVEVLTGLIEQPEKSEKEAIDFHINNQMVQGCLDAGIGYTAMDKIFTAMEIPSIGEITYKNIERNVGHEIEEQPSQVKSLLPGGPLLNLKA